MFQADQQLYPLLELADYFDVTGRLPDLPVGVARGRRSRPRRGRPLNVPSIPAHGLIGSERERRRRARRRTHTSSPTRSSSGTSATRLADAAGQLGLARAALLDVAASGARRGGRARHHVDGPHGPQWARSVDGRGGRRALRRRRRPAPGAGAAVGLLQAHHACLAQHPAVRLRRRQPGRHGGPGGRAGLPPDARARRRSATSWAGWPSASWASARPRIVRWNGSSMRRSTMACCPRPTTRKARAASRATGTPGRAPLSPLSCSSTRRETQADQRQISALRPARLQLHGRPRPTHPALRVRRRGRPRRPGPAPCRAPRTPRTSRYAATRACSPPATRTRVHGHLQRGWIARRSPRSASRMTGRAAATSGGDIPSRLSSSAWRAARRQVTFGPLPPTMMGTRGRWMGLGTLYAPATRALSGPRTWRVPPLRPRACA